MDRNSLWLKLTVKLDVIHPVMMSTGPLASALWAQQSGRRLYGSPGKNIVHSVCTWSHRLHFSEKWMVGHSLSTDDFHHLCQLFAIHRLR